MPISYFDNYTGPDGKFYLKPFAKLFGFDRYEIDGTTIRFYENPDNDWLVDGIVEISDSGITVYYCDGSFTRGWHDGTAATLIGRSEIALAYMVQDTVSVDELAEVGDLPIEHNYKYDTLSIIAAFCRHYKDFGFTEMAK